jgi:serine/threonine protein kinase
LNFPPFSALSFFRFISTNVNGQILYFQVAVKFERHSSRCPQLRHEYKVYREITACPGFASVYYFGQQDNYNVMVMDLLGPSLEDLFNKCNRRFSLKTVLQLADQLLERVDTLHARHLIHRDIKPANFVIGLGDQGNNVYCVDFGLSKRYRHPKNLQHIPHRDGRSLTGTPRYASVNNHLGVEQSRRDDLESIGYVLIYFLKGCLPWQGLKAKNAQKKYRLILEKKQQVSIAQLCHGFPSQFAEFLAYARSLKFDAKPDVQYLRKMFRDLYHSQGLAGIGKIWDWDPIDVDFMASGGSSAPAGGPPASGFQAGEMDNNAGNAAGNHNAGRELRPTTAGAVASRPQSSQWGYSRPEYGNSADNMAPQQAGSNPMVNSAHGGHMARSGAAAAPGSGSDYVGASWEANRASAAGRPHTAHVAGRVNTAPYGSQSSHNRSGRGGAVDQVKRSSRPSTSFPLK